MNRRPRILFFADGGPEIGGGHVMRCLTLAGALCASADCAFVASPAVKRLIETFGPAGIEALDAPEPGIEPARTLADAYRPDGLVIDHYHLNLADERALRAPGRRLMAMDDLADRPRDCDVLLNSGYGCVARDYRGLVPAGARVLAGPRYALVRPQFAAIREKALARRGEAPVRRALVSLGLTDVGGVTARVVQALLPVLGDVRLDVVLGSAASSLGPLKALNDPRVSLYVDTPDMARLTAEADLAIGAGGSSIWERACLGLPAVTVILADNQRDQARRMESDGLTIAVDGGDDHCEARVRKAFERLANEGLRADISDLLSELCDGLGAPRIANLMFPSPSRGEGQG